MTATGTRVLNRVPCPTFHSCLPCQLDIGRGLLPPIPEGEVSIGLAASPFFANRELVDPDVREFVDRDAGRSCAGRNPGKRPGSPSTVSCSSGRFSARSSQIAATARNRHPVSSPTLPGMPAAAEATRVSLIKDAKAARLTDGWKVRRQYIRAKSRRSGIAGRQSLAYGIPQTTTCLWGDRR